MTWREHFNTWPKVGQRLLVFVTAVCMLLFFGAIIAWPDSFTFALITWLIGWLALFHLMFWNASGLTQRHVRIIDYFYIGIATAGIVFLAADYDSKRSEYELQVMFDERQARAMQAHTDARIALENFRKLACSDLVSEHAALCDATEATSEGLSNPGLADLTTKFREILDRNSLKSSNLGTRASKALKEFYLADMLRDNTKHHLQRRRDRERHQYWSLFIWPFLLSWALALRLTKVSIEVFEWTKPPR